MHLFFIFMIVFFKLKNAMAPEYTNMWVIWNVGQGQWVTHIIADECHHFDSGGELGSFNRLKRPLIALCAGRTNRLTLSHWDIDHFMNIPALARSLPKVCWQTQPEAFADKKAAQKILQLAIPRCDLSSLSKNSETLTWISPDSADTNKSSSITIENNVLNTGDSPISVEKLWAHEMPGLEHIEVLMLGHHGSRTSSGHELLRRLIQLRWAAASARQAKYGHPHNQTIIRLAQRSIPVLRTEIWGNIWFQTQPTRRF